MVALELNKKELEELRVVLGSYEKELRGEIVKTDDRELKTILHKEEDVVMGLLKKVA